MRPLPTAVAATMVLFLAGACQRQTPHDATQAATPPATVTVDPSGDAPPQPNPNGGDTPAGAAGPGGISPTADKAAVQGDPSAPGTTSRPQ